MARWDEILSLPVQNPSSLEFSAADLVWSKVEGWRDNIDTIALIQFARVDDFVRGESSNTDCPTRFHVEARRRRSPQTPYKPKVDGILEYILYWCSFGPDDHRKGGVVRPSRSTYVPKKNTAGRPNTKRGCTCHFIVKRLIAEPSVALVIYNQDKHVDKKGFPCHGPQDKKAVGTRAMYAPYISEDLRLRVFSLLYVGVPVEAIMQRHNECVQQQGGPCSRDDLLTHRYVRRQERSIRRSTYELDEDDAVSVGLWVHTHQSNIFFYEDFSESGPLILGIQSEWQLQQMIMFGNKSLLLWDCRFGTNKLKYPFQSLLVFNADNKAIPVAWIISPRFSTVDVYRWMIALYNRVHTKDPTWKPAGFVVDDPFGDIRTIRDVFECSVLISFWRVRHSWRKHLEKSSLDTNTSVELFKWLGKAVHDMSTGDTTTASFEIFLKLFGHASYFTEYFKAVWLHRIESWATALQNFPVASQETGAAIEFYHNQMKLRLLNGEDDLHRGYHRADWLVYRLTTRVHSYFWLDEYREKDIFLHFLKQEGVFGLTPWQKASLIPDSSIVHEEGGYTTLVSGCDDEGNAQAAAVVGNPGSEFGVCDCNCAKMGNICEHVLKTLKVMRESVPSMTLRRYNQALHDILFRAPFDSLVQDHGVSLAVSVQTLLNSLSGHVTVPAHDELTNGRCRIEEIILPQDTSNNENGSTVGRGSCEDSGNGCSQLGDVCSSATMGCLVKCNRNGLIHKPNGSLDDDEDPFS